MQMINQIWIWCHLTTQMIAPKTIIIIGVNFGGKCISLYHPKISFCENAFFGKIFKLKMTINSERPFKRFMFHKMCTFSWQLSHYSSKFKGDLTVCISHTENNSYILALLTSKTNPYLTTFCTTILSKKV